MHDDDRLMHLNSVPDGRKMSAEFDSFPCGNGRTVGRSVGGRGGCARIEGRKMQFTRMIHSGPFPE